ncbi:MAG: glutamine--fructose-6-phosphate transaminase (isomerizing), partial [Dehalococcoidia bacterium]|nr:glutamine--fructose-6-phosphate transaminase (isomerizing) [Dehalococcoidia bacterium]
THGGPSASNAHPHLDCRVRIAVVHNGIITNYQSLRRQLTNEGHLFLSDTDTEVIPHLIEKHYQPGKLAEAVEKAAADLQGSYAIAVISEDEPELIVARLDSPLIVGIGDRENIVASDVPAVLDYASKVVYLENGEIGVLTGDVIKIRRNGIQVEPREHLVCWTSEDVQRTGYEHFMLKEIHEQPRVIRDTLRSYTPEDRGSAKTIDNLFIMACGTSYHAGLVGKYLFEELGIPVRVEIASEISHFPRMPGITEAIVITQSGETADVLLAMKRLKELMVPTVVVTNVPGSTASRMGEYTIYTRAGPEVSVAATKTFVAQLIVLYQHALSYAGGRREFAQRMGVEMRQLPNTVQMVLDNETPIIECARFLSRYDNAFFIGRGINLPVALEGALKLKEISYIHAEGYAAGELKHGSFALLHEDIPVVAIAAPDHTYESMLTSIKEIKARNAPVIALADCADSEIEDLVDFVLRVPHEDDLLSPFANVVTLQLLAYHTARYRGCPIDFPRNLAKSVTVS